ncbi:MAG: xanthine dehydrogenase family protein subunit M [Candidatus Aminicenantes bacterium]|nr:xanthine dehydrogenase family protein subunit M [Candidatus Aminicenantes bacterium]
MNAFKLAQPRTTDEVAALLAAARPGLFLMAGGTDLLDEMKSGVVSPEVVVDLQAVQGLAGITAEKDGLRIGAMTTVAELADDPTVARDYPGLRQAALSLASPQLRAVGTVGGNLCQRPRCWYYRDPQVICRKKGGSRCFAARGRNKYHAIFGGGICYIVFPSDLAPMLMSLGAQVEVGRSGGEKTVLLEEFYQLPSVNVRQENVLQPGEFVRSIKIPAPKPGQKSVYVKLKERGTWDFALVSTAATAVVGGKKLASLSLVLGGVAPIPWRLKKAEDVLRGQTVTEELVKRAAAEAIKDASPLAENGYKTKFLAAALKQAVLALIA